MRGRLFVISGAGSDGTNTSQTATYKCLVSASQWARQSALTSRQTILNFTKWQVSPLAAVSQSVWNQFPEVWCKPELHNFCLLAYDWWWDRSVFNQRYLGPLESWNKMFYCREQFLLRQSWMNGELYSNTVCFYQLQEAKLLIDSSESVIDISINFHFIKTFPSLHSAACSTCSTYFRCEQRKSDNKNNILL